MKINIYYGGRGILDDPTLFVIGKMTEVLTELNVNVERFPLYELRNQITSLPASINEADGIILATTVEWYGVGGLMMQFLDACWLYGNKEKISKTYMCPVVMSISSGEREAKTNLQVAWEILGGLPCSGLCGYVEDMTNFELNNEYIKIIEKKTENLYRTISQKMHSLPSSNQAVKQIVGVTKNIPLTPQETEQLSKYASDEQLDYADYDWDGNGSVEVVIYIYAGYGGNEDASEVEGCIWPNTSSFATQNLDGVKVNRYSASPELWSNDASCGIGTICHEFSHALGLPDMYPTSGSEFSVLDEWDLMDGGNFVDDGWCPPNYSIHEREYLGWASAEDLTKTTTVTLMPSYDSSGKAYRIVNDACTSEYYLLENRQKEGWDAMLPNHGLLITHVDFLSSAWTGNSPNSNSKHHRVEYFHADNRDYNDYEALSLKALKYTTYPYTDDDGVVHNALTDGTTPASSLFNKASTGRLFMGKPLLDITESADGLISFNFFSYTDVEGDVNGDGMVDVADVVIISRLIMAGAYCPSADIDDDKEVSAEDIVKATNLIFAK